ncbi:MAG: DUF4239 domain-containing protein [Verrucomicrobia bacterium]|nr:DUF4239 domain-containing protein [Verrucomicrobiota bacterium]MBS0645260.1 DUF4239 domain-containing protein [Verrucomicrobiota bacterium]
MLPIWLCIVIFLVVFSALFYLTRRFRGYLVSKEHPYNNFLGPAQQLIGLIYGVMLAFVVVFSWQNYTTLHNNLEKEAVSLFDAWKDAKVFDVALRQKFNIAILNYLKSIRDVEWPLMKQGKMPPPNEAYLSLWDTVAQIEVHTDVQKAFLTNLISELNVINSFRMERMLAISSPTPPILWVFLIGGAMFIIMLTDLYSVSPKLSLFLASLQALIIVFAFYLISNFNHPFEGPLAIKNEAYKNVEQVISNLDNRSEIT